MAPAFRPTLGVSERGVGIMPTGGLPAFMDEVPEYFVKSGRMYICAEGFSLTMPIHVFLDGCELGKAAIIEWQRKQCGLDVDDNVVFMHQRS